MRTIQADYSEKELNMGCGCGDGNKSEFLFHDVEGEYSTLDKRLVDYGKEVYGTDLMDSYPLTHIWLFTFYCTDEMEKCTDCMQKIASMGEWINKYGLLDDSVKNVKWVIDDEPGNNLILRDLHIEKTPVHIFTSGDGKIIDILYGFPDTSWLEKYILPLVRKDIV